MSLDLSCLICKTEHDKSFACLKVEVGPQLSALEGRSLLNKGETMWAPVSSELLGKASALGRRIPSVVTCKHLSTCALGVSQVTLWGSQE